MENIKFLSAENEIQKIYSNLGLIVPVGDLSTGKAPAVQPLPSTSTQDSITFNFNVMSGAEITGIEYKVNDGNTVAVTPQKGVVSIELEELEHNSGPYEIELTVSNETGDTVVTQTADLQLFTDWATANEVLEGNKFIGEDGQEHIGTLVPSSPLRIGHIVDWEYAPDWVVDGVTYNDGYVISEVIEEGGEPISIYTHYTQQEFGAFMLENDYVRLDSGEPCWGQFYVTVVGGQQEFDAYDHIENMSIAVLGVDCDPCQELGCNEEVEETV